MPSIALLVNTLKKANRTINFKPAHEFRWSPSEKVVYYDEASNDSAALLHELAHAQLNHSSYQRDIELIGIERDAWQYAKLKLAPLYTINISEDDVQDSLDTYRDWIHARSTCPNCHASGIQSKKYEYSCIACHSRWKVNDARMCRLRRQKIV